MKLRIECHILRILAFLLTLSGSSQVMAQVEDLKPAAVRIQDVAAGSWGNGFVFKIDDAEHVVYILTNAHVTGEHGTVNVIFSTAAKKPTPQKPVEGVVVRRDKERDLVVVKVTGQKNIPSDVMLMAFAEPNAVRAGYSVQSVTYSAANDAWSVQGATVELLRDEILPWGSVPVHIIRLSGAIREGDSGSPVLLGDEVVGIVEAGAGAGTASSIAIQASTIEEFLGDLLPQRVVLPSYKPASPEDAPNSGARLCATQFLDLLEANRLADAYKQMATVVKNGSSEAAFISMLSPFVFSAKSGSLERTLGSSQRMSSVPGAPQITGDIYVMAFISRYRDYPNVRVFETITVLKEDNNWRVVSFIWNPQGSEIGR